MAAVRALAALAFAFAALAAGTCAAAPFAVQVGETRLALDAPPGFADTTFTGSPRLQDLAESLTSPSNRILLFAVTDGDLRRFTQGDTPDFRRYMVVVTPRAAERERINSDSFQRFVLEALRELGKPPAAGVEFTKHLDEQPPGQMSLLAELRRDANVVSVLQGMRLPPTKKPGLFSRAEPPRYVLTTTSLLVLRGKGLNLTVFTMYEFAGDVEWVKSTTLHWIEDLQKLNNR